MRRVKFKIECLPVAQPRPRATKVGDFVQMYEAPVNHAIHVFKAQARLTWSAQRANKFKGPVRAELDFLFHRKAFPKYMGTLRMPRIAKPDADNLIKAVLDALNGLAYKDDSQVFALAVSKMYAAEGEVPGVLVTLTGDWEKDEKWQDQAPQS